PSMVCVPTIEIDCAWHTHMLLAPSYRDFCMRHMRRIINHDDTIPETTLSKHANATQKAWES
ncbi:hypothetical protein BC940DRAFT_211756, partial [Gongronella butleri]